MRLQNRRLSKQEVAHLLAGRPERRKTLALLDAVVDFRLTHFHPGEAARAQATVANDGLHMLAEALVELIDGGRRSNGLAARDSAARISLCEW